MPIRVGFLDHQLPSCVQSRAGPGEGERDEQAQQAEHRRLEGGDPRVRRFAVTRHPPEANAAADLQQHQHAEEEAGSKPHDPTREVPRHGCVATALAVLCATLGPGSEGLEIPWCRATRPATAPPWRAWPSPRRSTAGAEPGGPRGPPAPPEGGCRMRDARSVMKRKSFNGRRPRTRPPATSSRAEGVPDSASANRVQTEGRPVTAFALGVDHQRARSTTRDGVTMRRGSWHGWARVVALLLTVVTTPAGAQDPAALASGQAPRRLHQLEVTPAYELERVLGARQGS